MATTTAEVEEKERREKELSYYRGSGYHAYNILRFAFAVIPILAGLDKFFHILTDWNKYLSYPFNVFNDAYGTMVVVGIIEIILGIGVWFKPKVFAYLLAIWLIAIIVNLFLLENYYDIILRDFGLLFGVLALARLSHHYDV
jgi:uncharacterized membrane protein YphA (DoxX/SURF4 family)